MKRAEFQTSSEMKQVYSLVRTSVIATEGNFNQSVLRIHIVKAEIPKLPIEQCTVISGNNAA
jgi:hypothetical protein